MFTQRKPLKPLVKSQRNVYFRDLLMLDDEGCERRKNMNRASYSSELVVHLWCCSCSRYLAVPSSFHFTP